MTLSDVDSMDTQDFLKACEYVDMKDHVIEAGEKDREAERKKPPKR